MATLSSLVPWAVARLDERDGEFILTAPNRGGEQPLLHAAPAWEALRPPVRNVSIATILTEDDGLADATVPRREASVADGHPPRTRTHYYYSGSLQDATTAHWRTEILLEDLSPRDALLLRDAPPLKPRDSPQPPAASRSSVPRNYTSLRLWLTSANVLARAHYDKSHNVLCVVRGRKRIVLWPPEELPALHLYPAVHAAHRQSQVSTTRLPPVRAALEEAEDSATAPSAPSLRGVVGEYALLDARALLGLRGAVGAELTHGECLYTPPYWAHAVYSPEPSVALAAFSTSWEQARWARSAWFLAPLGRFAAGGVCSRARGAALLISSFIHACAPILVRPSSAGGGATSPRAFLARVFAARFAPLYGGLHEPSTTTAGPSSQALSDCLAAAPQSPDAPELDADLRQRIRSLGAAVASLLTEADPAAPGGPRAFSVGVAMELAADYVEELAGWACGAEGAWRLLRLLALTEETDLQPEDSGAGGVS